MGFQTLAPNEFISGAFYCLQVYEIRGFTTDPEAAHLHSGQIKGTPFEFCIGASINDVHQKLNSKISIDNEQSWAKENQCSPPYLIIKLGPTKEYQGVSSLFQIKDDDTIVTYDSFAEAKEFLKAQESIVFPHLISALNCHIIFEDSFTRLLPLERHVYGITSDGKVIYDVRLHASGTAYTSRVFSEEELEHRLLAAIDLAGKIPPKVAKFYYLALNETDPLIRFLYFFLSIEIELHSTFGKIDLDSNLANLVVPPTRAPESMKMLFSETRHSWPALKDRFVWCVLCTWTQLTDLDIADFVRLKKTRDDIAHGSISVPQNDSIIGVEKLATKLQHARQ